VEFKPPPPPDDTPPDGACNPLFDELLFDEPLLDPFDELPDVPPDPLELVPEFDVPEDELELDDGLLPVLVAAWLDAGRTMATTPARATLARDTVVVVAVSRWRPCSRSATARATCRAASRSVPPWLVAPWLAAPWLAVGRVGSSQLFTLASVTRPAVSAVVEQSANLLSAPGGRRSRGGLLRDRAELPVFSNAQRRLSSCLGHERAPRGA
jgi:hypothetical protein